MRRALAIALAIALACLGCRRAPAPSRDAGLVARAGTVSAHDAGPPPRPRDPPPAPVRPAMFRLDPAHTGRSGYRLPRSPRVLARVHTEQRVSAQVTAVSADLLVVGSHDGVVYAFSPEGRRRWRVATGDRVYSTALATDGGVYLGSDIDRFLWLDHRGGLRLALATEDDADTAAALAPDGSLRFASGRTVYATDPDLTVRWRFDAGNKVFSSPAVSPEGGTFFGSQDDCVYALGPDGMLRWRYRTRGDVDAPPALDARGTVYVGSDDGRVYALGPDGAVKWSREVGGYVRAGVALGLDGSLVVGTWGPRVRIIALDAETGRERWSVPVPAAPTRDVGIASSALVDADGNYAVGAPDDALYVISPAGRVLHRLPLGGDVDGSPVLVRDGLVAVGCDDGDIYLVGDGEGDAGAPRSSGDG